MVKVRIETGLCCGFANCVAVCPEVFQMDPDTNCATLVDNGAAANQHAAQVQRAADECPSQAILVEENGN